MQLIVITPETDVPNELAIVNNMFSNGLPCLHLRKPGYTEAGYKKYISNIRAEYHSRIVIHNNYHLLNELHLGGIHLNSLAREDDQVIKAIAEILPRLISTSFHSWDEVSDNNFCYGYVFISPVFDSISKSGYKAGIDLGNIHKVKKELKAVGKYCPDIIGLGGVGIPQLEILKNAGFEGAAMLGAIWQSGDPVGTLINAMK